MIDNDEKTLLILDKIYNSLNKIKSDYTDESLNLDELAQASNLSSFHFNRLFKKLIGIPPRKFLMLIRLAESKKLLLETNWNSTDICFEVGYNSLGTYTTKFTEMVGVSPKEFRNKTDLPTWGEQYIPFEHISFIGKYTVSIELRLPENFEGNCFIGLFTTPMPVGQPIACAIQKTNGNVLLQGISPGEYFLFAAAYEKGCNLNLMLDSHVKYVFKYPQKIKIIDKSLKLSVPIYLKNKKTFDPPIVLSLPHMYKKIKDYKNSNLEEIK